MQRAIIVTTVLASACSGADTDDGTQRVECTVAIEAVAPSARSISIGEQVELAVVLRDSCAGLVSGARVDFAILDPMLDAQLTPPDATTDELGLGVTILRAGDTAGTLAIDARYADASSARFTVTITDPCEGHCGNGSADCGETGIDCGGACTDCPIPPIDDAAVANHTLPAEMICESTVDASISMRNSGTTTWSSGGHALSFVDVSFLEPGGASRLPIETDVAPGDTASFVVPLRAPGMPGTYEARFQMFDGARSFGEVASKSITVTPGCVPPAGCDFPAGVPDEGFIATATSYSDTDPAVDAAVNAAMEELTGCGAGSSCPITGLAGTTAEEICQSWFAAVNQRLRDGGLCAGQHELGSTDEIAVSDTGCTGKWYGYHVCFYGGPSVVWTPGARRGWWQIAPEWCSD